MAGVIYISAGHLLRQVCQPEIPWIQLVDVLVVTCLHIGVHGGELFVVADDEIDRVGRGFGARTVAGKDLRLDSVHAAEVFARKARFAAQSEQTFAEPADFGGRDAVGEIGGDCFGAGFVASGSGGGLEGERDDVFAQLRIARAFLNRVDGEVERLRDLGHTLGVVAGPAIM